MLKRIASALLGSVGLYSRYLLGKRGYLYEYGWFRSYKEKMPVDFNGIPLPWITYPAIDFLNKRINKEMRVFEYGCGSSTLWWALRVKEVISVEHDEAWYKQMVQVIPDNVKLFYIDLVYDGKYSKKSAEFEQYFDIIIIDGRDRVNCARNGINALKDNGVILWDNSDRQEYNEGYKFLKEQGFKKIEFVGMAPIENAKTETACFYRKNNCLEI